MKIVEQLLIDFNPRNLNKRCKNGQDYDYESLMKNNSNVNIPWTSLTSPIQKQLTWSHSLNQFEVTLLCLLSHVASLDDGLWFKIFKVHSHLMLNQC
jgi:hypothetical protein